MALTVPILEGLDGVQKMSKSLGNFVGITEPPAEMYGKLMSVSDDLMFRYFELVTRISGEEIQALRKLHPKEAKKRLAWTVTAMYHGEAGAREGEAHFSRVVQGGKAPDNVDEIRLPVGGSGVPQAILSICARMAATPVRTTSSFAQRVRSSLYQVNTGQSMSCQSGDAANAAWIKPT